MTILVPELKPDYGFPFYRAADGEDSVPDFSGRVFMRVIFPLKRTGNTLGWAEYNFTLLTLPSFQENPP